MKNNLLILMLLWSIFILVNKNAHAAGECTSTFSNKVATINNTGDLNTANLTSIALSGADVAYYTVTGGTCSVGSPVSANSTCTVNIQWEGCPPESPTNHVAVLTVSDGTLSDTVNLQKTGTTAGGLGIIGGFD